MVQIVAIMGLSALGVYAIIVGGAWLVHGRWGGPSERALFARWAGYGAVVMAAVVAWTAAGFAAFLAGEEFWRGAWVGASAVLWLGYAPALVCVVRAARRQQARAHG